MLPLELADPAGELHQVEGPLAADLDDTGNFPGLAHLLDDADVFADQRQRHVHVDSLVLAEELLEVHLCTASRPPCGGRGPALRRSAFEPGGGAEQLPAHPVELLGVRRRTAAELHLDRRGRDAAHLDEADLKADLGDFCGRRHHRMNPILQRAQYPETSSTKSRTHAAGGEEALQVWTPTRPEVRAGGGISSASSSHAEQSGGSSATQQQGPGQALSSVQPQTLQAIPAVRGRMIRSSTASQRMRSSH
ncbi:hypothetical protein [Bradyrhizobium sp.]|uniref:hypothetical protein n=1 Tax=Bradyrhizobium sp. TaxID=376 RepID=UPI0039E619D9